MENFKNEIASLSLSAPLSEAVRAAISLLEARNINSDYLRSEAARLGEPERFQMAKENVQALWNQEDMSNQLSQKAAQKVLNLLYLMEIRQPGFTTVDKLHAIHDLYIGNTLDTVFFASVNSDSTPKEASAALGHAVQHTENSNKVYPNLTPDEEAIWNRVKVYHEFPDGFRWVYALNENGSIASHIPSSITFKTMHHCGNTPDKNSNNQYWELRDATGKAYLTVILSPDGKIEESKSWGNQPSKYRTMIQPYVKWFLLNKATGVGRRYDYGYSTHSNYGVKDFVSEDPEFVNYIQENRPELMGHTENLIMLWKKGLDNGLITVDQLKNIYCNKMTLTDAASNYPQMGNLLRDYARRFGSARNLNAFGDNPFDVICFVCGGCPFTKAELQQLIHADRLSLAQFANYDIKLLDDDMQKIFIAEQPYNMDTLLSIAGEVGTFRIAPDLINTLIDTVKGKTPSELAEHRNDSAETIEEYRDLYYTWTESLIQLGKYLSTANPPEKIHDIARTLMSDPEFVTRAFNDSYESAAAVTHGICLNPWLDIFIRFSDIDIPPQLAALIRKKITSMDGYRANDTVYKALSIGRPRIDPIVDGLTSREITNMCIDTQAHKNLDARNMLNTVANLDLVIKMFPEYADIVKKLRPTLKLAFFCCSNEVKADEGSVAKMALEQITSGNTNRNSFLSAPDAAAIIAIGKYPEIMRHVTPVRVACFVFDLSAQIEHTDIRGPISIFSNSLVDILKTGWREMDEYDRSRTYLLPAYMVFDKANRRIGYPDNGDDIFNELFYEALRRRTYNVMDCLTSSRQVSIPKGKWPDYVSVAGSQEYFIRMYTIPGIEHRLPGEDDFYEYIAEYLLDPSTEPTRVKSVATDTRMRRRHIISKLSGLLKDMVESGKYQISIDRAKQLNSFGLIPKNMVTDLEVGELDSREDDEFDINKEKELEKIVSRANLERYSKSKKFAPFIVEVARAIIEFYEMKFIPFSERPVDMDDDKSRVINAMVKRHDGEMFERFATLATMLLAHPKTPAYVGAAALLRHSGIIDAFRIVANRYDAQHPLECGWDRSKEMKELVKKLDEMGKTNLKFVQSKEIPELPLDKARTRSKR